LQLVTLLNWEEVVAGTPTQPNRKTAIAHPRQDWGEAPDVPYFVGRTKELDQLQQWMIKERCRLVNACKFFKDIPIKSGQLPLIQMVKLLLVVVMTKW
jgi:hypothetical protein